MKRIVWVLVLVVSVSLFGCKNKSPQISVPAQREVGVTPDNSLKSTSSTKLPMVDQTQKHNDGLLTQSNPTDPLTTPTYQPSPNGFATSTSISPFRTSTPLFVLTATNSVFSTTGQNFTPTITRTPSITNTQTPKPTVSFTPTLTPTATLTQTPTLTQVSQNAWDGEWVINLQQENGSYQTGRLQVSTAGTQVNATATINGSQITLSGTLLQGSLEVRGLFTQNAVSASFLWRMLPEGRWIGNTNNLLAFCGSRQGVDYATLFL